MAGPSSESYDTFLCPNPLCGSIFPSSIDVQTHLSLPNAECSEWLVYQNEEDEDGEYF